MANAERDLVKKGFPNTANCVNTDDVWRSMMHTLRFAFGIRGSGVFTPLTSVREMIGDEWAITDYGLYSVLHDFKIMGHELFDSSRLDLARHEAIKRGEGESFDQAVTFAKELFHESGLARQ